MEHSDQFSSSSVPRLRVTRNTLTDPTSWRNTFENNSGASEHTNLVVAPVSQDYQSTSEDEFALEEAQGPNTRLLSASLPPVDDSFHTSETSHRLRSILERFDKPSRAVDSASRISMPPTPSEPDFDFDLEPAQTARHSIRSLIENALREPGDTPQKSKLLRRASFNASDSPKVDKTIRRSLSDEEREAQSQIPSQLDTGIVASSSIQPNKQDLLSTQPTTPEQISVSHHTSKIPFRSGLIARHRSHKDLEPFKPISSESGLSSPEKSQGRNFKSHQILSNFNPDNFASYLNSNTKESIKSQLPNVTNGKATADNHLRPSSPSISASSSRTPSPNLSHTELGTKLKSVHDSSPTNARYRKLSHKESYDNYKDASERDENIKDMGPERAKELELERNWNRHRSLPSPMHIVKPGSPRVQDDHVIHNHEKLSHNPSFSRHESGHRSTPVASTSSDEEAEKLYEKERNWNSPKPRHFLQTSKVSHEHSRRTLHSASLHSSRSHSPSSSSPVFLTPKAHFSEVSRSQSPLQPHSIGFSPPPSKESDTDELPYQDRIETPPASLSKATSSSVFNTGTFSRGSHPKLNDPSLYDPPTSTDFHPPFSKGHRRTITELSELAKPSSPVQSFLGSDISAETFEPPHMSTPTSKSPKLPDEKVSLPRSPSSSVESLGKAAVQADLARLHKAIQPDFTFPSPSAQARDPSPPQESSHEDELSSHAAVVDETRILRHEQSVNSTYLKTPRPPGAFGTPYSQVKREPGKFAPFQDTPSPNVGLESEHNGRDSYVNNDMSTLATPAPPGAYRMTPGTTKRKGILKIVRFDDGGTHNTAHEDSADRELTPESKDQATDTVAVNMENDNLEESVKRRKGLRLVDEYGRVRKFTEDGVEVPLDRKGSGSQPDLTAQHQSTSLSGIEPISVTEQQSIRNTSVETMEYDTDRLENSNSEYLAEPNDKKAVVAHLTKSLGKMQATLAQEEETLATSLSKDKTVDNGRLNSLATVSRTARLEREKLVHRLEAEKNAEGKIQKKLFTARSTSAHTPRGSWWLRRWRLLLLGLILEFCFLYLGYRVALVHSKHLWLGTHFDPFYPALYIHKLQPMFLNHPNMLPVNWSVFSVPNTIGNIEMGYTMKDVGRRLWDTAWNWRSVSWDSWGTLAPQTWPS